MCMQCRSHQIGFLLTILRFNHACFNTGGYMRFFTRTQSCFSGFLTGIVEITC